MLFRSGGAFFFKETGTQVISDTIGAGVYAAFAIPLLPTTVNAESKSAALYGQAEYKFSDKLKLTLGGRYNHDSKTLQARTLLFSDGRSTEFTGGNGIYAPFGVKPFMGGNTGVCMGGWFRREINGLADLRGLKIRLLGLGGEVFRRLGATSQTTPPAEMLTSLQSGVIDGAEFVGPGSDIALGLYRVAPFYYGPGFNKPNGTGECIVSLKLWETLDSETKAIIAHATAVEANFALSEMERLNAEALVALTGQHRVQLRAFPGDVIAAARKQATEVLAELGGRSDKARRVHASYTAFHERTAPWSRISLRAVLEAREG